MAPPLLVFINFQQQLIKAQCPSRRMQLLHYHGKMLTTQILSWKRNVYVNSRGHILNICPPFFWLPIFSMLSFTNGYFKHLNKNIFIFVNGECYKSRFIFSLLNRGFSKSFTFQTSRLARQEIFFQNKSQFVILRMPTGQSDIT